MRTSTVTVVAAFLVGLGHPALAAPPSVPGSVRVTIVAPEGVPATVTLAGRTKQLAAKQPAGKSAVVTLTPADGLYAVLAPALIFDGVRYVGRASTPAIGTRRGRKAAVKVTYAADGAARDLHAATVTATGVSLAWKAPAGSAFVLRRNVGRLPVAGRSLGAGVRVRGATAVDSGLKPGRQYTYALFTRLKGRWFGPLTITAAPASPTGAAKYVANPATLLARPADLVSAVPTGSGVQAVLRNGVATPMLGAAVVLPISAALPGGFLGVVTAVSADGRTLSLRAGAIIDAFDYYELNVPDFTVSAGTAPAAKAFALSSCNGESDEMKVVFSPHLELGGHFYTKVDKYSFLGAEVPTGASLDMGLKTTLSGPASVKVSGSRECSIELPHLFKQLSVSPVPMAVSLEMGAEINLGGAMEVSNVGLTATAGFDMKGSMTVKNGASFSGNRIMDVTPLTPKVTANGSIGLKVAGELIGGPGAGTKDAGVIAGIGGSFGPVDASFGPVFNPSDSRYNACVEAKLEANWGLYLTAKAFLSDWSYSTKVTLEALEGSHPYAGSPYYLPKDCKTKPAEPAEPGGPKDSLFGDGVDKVDDTTVGAPEQWGHVDGFVPGKKTWVLSTGQMADALGDPSKFASTGLDREGDAELTEFAGHDTHDAASYQVTLVPAGKTLHVRYVFASEEYPEFVNSSFNDVMAVRVAGKNCAVVPGTTQPVSVNTINADENATYYVDNADGAAGYATSMDGLTKPLTCSVPVTPGKAVTVQIAVADSTDNAYDSAIALVDGGIWTD